MKGTAGEGSVPVSSTSSTTVNTSGGSATVGHYALLVGTGSTSVGFVATYIATFTTQPSTVTVSGTYVGATNYGIEIKTTGSGTVPVMTSSATSLSGALSAGGAVSVTGVGNGSAMLASAITASGSGGTSTTAMKHLVTADWFGTPDGTTTVTPERAAPYLTWAETGVTNANTVAAAGIKTMVYIDMDRVQSNDPLYAKLSGTEYEETCSGTRVSDSSDSVTQYITNPTSSAMRAAAAAVIASETAGYTVNLLFEDDADPLSQLPASYFSPGMPCNYSDSTWNAGQEALLDGLGHDVIVNGFSKMSSTVPVTNTIDELGGSSIVGGNMESCYVSNAATKEQGVWVWTGTEDTELKVASEDKYFQCWAMDYGEASSEISSRTYALASFLMTYNPTYSIFREGYATPSGLHVMPESQLVPTEPVVATPATIGSLEKSDVYVREYRACYYAGKLVGQCAMVVNNDTAAHARPALTLTYQHTLTLSGGGILDGGSAGLSGAAPPASLAAESAFIALP